LTELERVLVAEEPGAAFLDLSWPVLARSLKSAHQPKFAEIAALEQPGQARTSHGMNIREGLMGLSGEALLAAVTEHLRESLGAVLNLPAPEVEIQVPIHTLGLDSLMAVELAVAVENGFGVRIPEMGLGDQTLQWLAERVVRLMSPGTTDADESEKVIDAQVEFLAKHEARGNVAAVLSAGKLGVGA
jgi:acyl carrier protein